MALHQLVRGAALVVAAPVFLAALSVMSLPDDPTGRPSVSTPTVWPLVYGPLLETALLIVAARTVLGVFVRIHRLRIQSIHDPIFDCGALVGFAFVTSHLVESGPQAIASLPMALLLSFAAADAASRSVRSILFLRAPILVAMHAVYNAAILLSHSAPCLRSS